MSEYALKSQQVYDRHIKIQAERINQATWPGKDLWEIAELQLKLEAAEKRIEEWIKVGESAERPELLTLYHISGTNAMGRFVTIGYWTQAKGWKEWDGNTLKIDYYKPITKPQPPEPQP